MAQPVIIDVHMHLYRYRHQAILDKANYQIWEYGDKRDVRFSDYVGDLDDALKAIDEAGVSKAVVVNLFASSLAREHAISELSEDLDGEGREKAIREIDGSMGERLKESNAWVCGVGRTHPQIVPFIAVDPEALSVQGAQDHLREMVERHGAKGIKVHPPLQQFYMNDVRMLPIYETCMELDIPVLAHSGPSRGNEQYGEPSAFAEVLGAFPRLRVVLAHMGGGAWRQLREIADAYPNVCFDCCEIIQWTGGSNAATERELAQLIHDVGPERVMMGSDFPWYDLDHNVERVMELPLLSKEEKEAILGANALKLLGL